LLQIIDVNLPYYYTEILSFVHNYKFKKIEEPEFLIYLEKYCKNMGLIYDDDLYHEYNYQNNAMYTYYTNLKQTATLTNKLKAYNYFPTTIKDLTSKDANGDYIYNKKITTLSSGEDGKLITFRIWLEGWDADCFDGLKDSITASLSFSSKRIY